MYILPSVNYNCVLPMKCFTMSCLFPYSKYKRSCVYCFHMHIQRCLEQQQIPCVTCVCVFEYVCTVWNSAVESQPDTISLNTYIWEFNEQETVPQPDFTHNTILFENFCCDISLTLEIPVYESLNRDSERLVETQIFLGVKNYF